MCPFMLVKKSGHISSRSSESDHKKKCSEYGESSKGHFWELSCEVLNRIERNGYVENKNLHNEYLKKNPFVAKAKFFNLN